MSDEIKDGQTLSSMGEIETIYEGGWDHNLNRIGKWGQGERLGDRISMRCRLFVVRPSNHERTSDIIVLRATNC
jgi:hypothetical protein